jgi:hypothetical protein
MNAFQLRLELIKLAKDMLEQEYHSKREVIHNNWQVATENARTQGQNLPNQPEFPPFPSEEDIIKKAQTLNGFVSGPSTDLPVATKSTHKGK